jgi:eukaryotic-like serine/threonine-protein kinase
VKVGDFGLARDLTSTRLTLEGQTVGTCRYMPPEQIAGEAELTGATDLYALGCILHEMLTGGTPFNGQSIVEIFEAHLNEDPTPPRELVRDCPAELSDLVLQLLAKSPDDRPARSSAVRIALQDILHSRLVRKPAAAKPKGARDADGDHLIPPPANEPNLTERLLTPAATMSQDPSRSIAMWAIAGAVLLTLVAVLAWVFVG